MKLADIEAIVRALDRARVRYIVVGGSAVVAHGYGRLTIDLDLVMQLEPSNIEAALGALHPLGYRPRQPVTAKQFADPVLRQSWIETKNMRVLNLYSDSHRETTIDVFVQEPFDFDPEYARALEAELIPGLPMKFVCIDTLIAMKRAAGRPRDLDDIWHLTRLKEETGDASKE